MAICHPGQGITNRTIACRDRWKIKSRNFRRGYSLCASITVSTRPRAFENRGHGLVAFSKFSPTSSWLDKSSKAFRNAPPNNLLSNSITFSINHRSSSISKILEPDGTFNPLRTLGRNVETRQEFFVEWMDFAKLVKRKRKFDPFTSYSATSF